MGGQFLSASDTPADVVTEVNQEKSRGQCRAVNMGEIWSINYETCRECLIKRITISSMEVKERKRGLISLHLSETGCSWFLQCFVVKRKWTLKCVLCGSSKTKVTPTFVAVVLKARVVSPREAISLDNVSLRCSGPSTITSVLSKLSSIKTGQQWKWLMIFNCVRQCESGSLNSTHPEGAAGSVHAQVPSPDLTLVCNEDSLLTCHTKVDLMNVVQ